MSLFFCAIFYFAYWAWPTGILDMSLSNLTLGLLLRAGLSVLLWLLEMSTVIVLLDEFKKQRFRKNLDAISSSSSQASTTKEDEK